ncbi:hypothetical protein [Arenibaculum pallidiluteum]|uniref:hypothetical protein n=1 Tax=Arenibaculum pallidiluteum TaxID=2812559 RepID=UPI001A95DBEE|nr:hypothetical protein [Arenibaculum pallidiluteum]
MSSNAASELFVDGLLDVSFARGIVRVDLYSLSAVEKNAQGQPKPELRQRLVLSAQGFVDLVNGLQIAAQSLRERGALPGAPAAVPLRAVEAEAPAPEPDAAPAAAAAQAPADTATRAVPARTPRSPNFPASADQLERV